MYTPHTVTIYNVLIDRDPATFEEEERLYVTVLRGVFLEAAKAANVAKTGLEGADAANLYIPFSVSAVDGVTGVEKAYAGPQEFYNAADRAGLWTLSVNGNGGETLFVKGDVVEDSVLKVYAHDDCYRVTKVDAKDFGSATMQHWEVGGV